MSFDLGAIITLFVFLLAQLIAGIWWASKMSTTLIFIKEQVDALVRSSTGFVTVVEHSKDVGRLEKSMEAIWKRLDAPHACPNRSNNGQA